MIASIFLLAMASVAAQGPSEEAIGTNQATRHINAGETSSFRFRSQTRLSFNCTCDLTVNMDVDTDSIGDKNITIDLNCSEPLEMSMTCTESQAELGAQNGNTVQTRTQNRYRFQYGFVANISVNCTQFTARLRAQVGNLNGLVWAFYNETMEQWEEVPTVTINGEAVAEVNHFSTWTLLTPESAVIGVESIGLLVAAFATVGVLVVSWKIRKHA